MFFLSVVVGLAFGSFISAFTYRYPKGISILKGRSFCDRCKREIGWKENIPLLSYLFLKGRCKYCKKKISLRYPLIEIMTAIGLVLLANLPDFYFFGSLFLILLAVLIIDWEKQMIPDDLVFGAIGITLLYFFLINYSFIFINILSGLTASLFLLGIYLATKGRGMGLGDVKLALLGGLVLGWPDFVVWLFLSFVTGALVGLILILFKKAKFREPIPFGPFLVICFWLTVILR